MLANATQGTKRHNQNQETNQNLKGQTQKGTSDTKHRPIHTLLMLLKLQYTTVYIWQQQKKSRQRKSLPKVYPKAVCMAFHETGLLVNHLYIIKDTELEKL